MQTEYVGDMLERENSIIGFRNVLQQVKLSCITCRHRNAKPFHTPMADIPQERPDEHVFPFIYTGFDCLGPIKLKFLRRILKNGAASSQQREQCILKSQSYWTPGHV